MPNLESRLGQLEDNFTERKRSLPNRRDLRQTLVAFANTVPQGEEAVLFVGVEDDGNVCGVDGTDSLQRTVRSVCDEDCYPPIAFRTEVLNTPDGAVLAVAIPYSEKQPHFSGPAYVRRGSESVKASESEYERLILSRSDKCREILSWGNSVITVITRGKELGSTKVLRGRSHRTRADCQVTECSAHVIRLFVVNSSRNASEPLRNVTVLYDEERHRPLLLIEEPYNQ